MNHKEPILAKDYPLERHPVLTLKSESSSRVLLCQLLVIVI